MEIYDSILKQLVAVDPQSREWMQEEYRLQVLSKNNGLVLRGMWDIKKHSWEAAFRKKFPGRHILPAYNRVNQLGEDNQLRNLIQRGLVFGLQGMQFTAGIPVSLANEEEDLLVVSQIYVGKSIYKKKRPKDKIKMPPGYDSIYILEDGDDQFFICDFILYSEEQVLPVYLLKVGYDPSKVTLTTNCCNCLKPASRYCADEKLPFCMDCDADHHCSKDNSIKIMLKHRRTDFKSREKDKEKCSIHPAKEMVFFCLVCRRPLCVLCKIDGHHFEDRAGGHRVVQIDTYYSEISEQIRGCESYFEPHKNQLKGVLRDIENCIKQVRENEKAIQQQIYETINRAIDQLKEVTEKKLTLLFCEELEVKRRMERISHLEQAITKQLSQLDKCALSVAYDRFLEMREDFIYNSKFPIKVDIQADMRLEGELLLMHEDFKPDIKKQYSIPVPTFPPQAEEEGADRTLSLIKTKLIEGPKFVIPQNREKKQSELVLNTLRTTWDKKVHLN